MVLLLQPLFPSPLPTPVRNGKTTDTTFCRGDAQGKRSDRLAAKPTAGWTAMEKVQLVLLKKSGLLKEEAAPKTADLRQYRNLYSNQLPNDFMDAVTDLVEAGPGRHGGSTPGLGLLAV